MSNGKPSYEELERQVSELKNQELFFRSLLDFSPIGIFQTDITGNCVFVNRMWQEITGLSQESAMGEGWVEGLHEDDRDRVCNIWEQAAATGSAFVEEYRFQTTDGKTVWVEGRGGPVKNENNETVGWVGSINDITEKRNSYTKIKESEERFRLLYESLGLGVGYWNPDFRVVFFNDEALRNMGGRLEDYEGKTAVEIFGESEGNKYEERMQKCVRLKKKFDYEDRLKMLSGDKVFVSVYSPVVDDRGNVLGIQIVSNDYTEQKKVQEELVEKRKWFEDLIENLNAGVVVHAPDTSIIQANSTALRLLGFEKEVLSGKKAKDRSFDFINEKGSKLEIDQYPVMQVINKNEPLKNMIGAIKYSDQDELKWVLCNGFPVCDEEGELLHVIITFIDITERRNAEIALTESEERFQLAMQATSDGLYDWDLVTNEIYYSPTWKKMLGYEDHEIRNEFSEWERLTSSEDVQKSWAMLKDHLDGKIDRFEIEFKMKHKDGHWVDILSRANAIFDDAGKPVRVVGTHIDITDRKQIELELIQNEGLLREAQMVANVGSWYYDPETQMPVWSEQMFRIFGLDPEKGVPNYHAHREFIHPDDWDKFDSAVARAIKEGTGYNLELRIVMKDSSLRFINTICMTQKNGDGKVVGLIGAVKDLTEQKELEKAKRKVLEQEKMAAIGRVAGKMAHDMNNVLGMSMSLSDLILYTHDLSPALRADIEAIKESSERGAEITRNLLFFARDKETQYSKFDLNEKIDTILKSIKYKLNNLQVTVQYDSKLKDVIADSGMLQNALLNLVQNSIHAMSKTLNPKLSIQTIKDEDVIKIIISDNGCGIEKENIEKIFDVSFTLKGNMDQTGSYAKDIKGSGYGMANVQKTIAMHDGTIEIDSEFGHGTTVIITLPEITANLESHELKKINVNHDIKNKKILVVEDEHPFADILYRLLRKFDHKVHKASKGQEAIDLISENEYDVISLDFILPDMSGMKVYNHIRGKNTNIPVIFVSGNFEFMQSMIDLKEKDPNVDHLAKPFNNIEYLNKIHSWLK